MTRDEILNMQAGSGMDMLVAKWVMGYTIVGEPGTDWYLADGWKTMIDTVCFLREKFGATVASKAGFGHFHPSTDIAAAWEVVEKFAHTSRNLKAREMQFSHFWINAYPDGHWNCSLGQDNHPVIDAQADTAPLAICRAALLAVMEFTE